MSWTSIVVGSLALSLGGCDDSKDTIADRWSLAVSEHHCLFVSPSNNLYASGLNHMGQLGEASADEQVSLPIRVSTLSNISQVAAGLAHSVVLSKDGKVYAFGDNHHGQVGRPTLRYSRTPERLPEVDGAIKIAASGAHSMALTRDGILYGWGSNQQGQLGSIKGTHASRPVPLFDHEGVVDFATSPEKTVILMANGNLRTIGRDGIVDRCCQFNASRVLIRDDAFSVIDKNGAEISHIPLTADSQHIRTATRHTTGTTAPYDDLQKVSPSTWVAIRRSGAIDYGGNPCGFPARP